MIWYDTTWFHTIWYNIIWYNIVWYDVIWYHLSRRTSSAPSRSSRNACRRGSFTSPGVRVRKSEGGQGSLQVKGEGRVREGWGRAGVEGMRKTRQERRETKRLRNLSRELECRWERSGVWKRDGGDNLKLTGKKKEKVNKRDERLQEIEI